MNLEKIKDMKKAELRTEISNVQSALNNTYKNLQMAKEPDLLDYFAYKIKSEEAMHQYLIKKFKEI